MKALTATDVQAIVALYDTKKDCYDHIGTTYNTMEKMLSEGARGPYAMALMQARQDRLRETGGALTRVIIESPYAGDVERNKQYLQMCIRDCISRGETPYASHQMCTDALDDSDSEQRKIGMQAGRAWYGAADMCVVYADYGISDGMHEGIAHCASLGLMVEIRRIL